MIQNDVQAFLSLLGDTADAWRSIDIRCVAVYFDGEFHNAIARLKLDHARPPEPEKQLDIVAQTRMLRAFRASLPASQLEPLLRRITSGYFEVGSEKAACLTGIGVSDRTPYTSSIIREAGLPGDLPSEPFGRSHLLRLSGDTMQFALQAPLGGRAAIDAELRASQVPWDGIDGVVEYLFGPGKHVDYDRQAFVEVVAPLEVRIEAERSSLANGQLAVAVITSNASLRDHCSLGFAALSASGSPAGRASARIAHAAWNSDEDLYRTEMAFELDPAARKSFVFLRVGGSHVIERAAISDSSHPGPNPRIIAYSTVDPGLAVFRQWLLDPEKNQAVEFERAVGRLFTFAGLVVDQFPGDKRLSDAVDVIAHGPGHEILFALECTNGPLQGPDGKPGKLVVRAAALTESLRDTFGCGVIPVMVTSLPAAQVAAADRQIAATNGITVLAREDLSELFDLVQQQETPGAAVDFIRSRSRSRS